jgi:hypothetical protein
MNAWHLDDQLAERYATGQTSQTLAASVEQHLIGCDSCRGRLSPYVDQRRSAKVLAEVLEGVQAPEPRLIERFFLRFGMAEATARLVAVTPSLHGGWLTSVAFVLGFAQLVAHSDASGVALYMALAPVLPLISVAIAFDADSDPSREMAGATPYSVLRLLLIRTAAVVVATIVPATLLALLLPGSAWLALGWLIPSLALIGAVLVLTPRAPALPTAGVLAALWVAIVGLGWLRRHDPFLAASFAVQAVSVGVLVITVVLLLVRQDKLAEEIRRPA